jgi:hypothetical protein
VNAFKARWYNFGISRISPSGIIPSIKISKFDFVSHDGHEAKEGSFVKQAHPDSGWPPELMRYAAEA